jgi:hypothetical protein
MRDTRMTIWTRKENRERLARAAGSEKSQYFGIVFWGRVSTNYPYIRPA